MHFALAGHLVSPPCIAEGAGGASRAGQGLASQAAAGGGRQDFPSILHNPTSSSDGAFSHPHKACQLFKLLLNTKPPVSTTERCIQRTLKKGSDIQMYKSRRCPPALASCPAPNPTAPRPPWSIRGAGAPSPMEGHRAPALHDPGLSCLQPPYPWPGRGKADKGRPRGEDSIPARGGLGGSNEP